MNSLKNLVRLIGYTGNNPEIKTTENGKKLAKFSIATNEIYHNAKGETVKETQWHQLIAWGKVADIVEKFLGKGHEVAIEGKLINSCYETQEGVKKHSTHIQVNELLLLGKKPSP